MKLSTRMIRQKILLLFFLSSTTVFAQRQNLLFESSFEGNDLTYLNGFVNQQHCCEYSVQRTMVAARTGASALRLEVRDDDPQVSSSIRSEVTMQSVTDAGEMWYGISFYLTNWIPDGSPHSIIQWHPNSSSGSSFISLQTQGGEYILAHGESNVGFHYETNALLGSPVSNVWTDFVFHVKWATNNTGFIQLWKNGVLVYDVSGIQTSWGSGQYLKVGINHWGWDADIFDVATERIYYIDDLRIGNSSATYADVAPEPPARKNLLFDAPFEGTDYLNGFNPYYYSACCEHSVTQSRNFAREGAYAVRLEVNDTDEVVSGSHGSELTMPETYDTGERWYGMSYYFGNYVNDESSESILNWHPDSPGGGPQLALFVQADSLVLVHQVANSPWDDYHYETISAVPLNQWADFVFHVNWAEDNTGFIEFYLNGVLVYSANSIRTSWTGGQFMKVGINKFCWDAPCSPASTVSQRVIYVDALRIGDENSNYASVAPGGVSSCIEPIAEISATPTCEGAPYYIVLSDATGTGPFDLWINDSIYYNVAEGDSILAVSPEEETIWDTHTGSTSVADPDAVELGVKFRSSKDGYIKGIRFFSNDSPSGTYVGHLWTSAGVLLDSVVFTSVTGGAWQQGLFASPVAIDANTIYVASYHTTDGKYRATGHSLTAPVINGSLEAIDYDESINGVYGYGYIRTFPTSSYNASNYWVDVLFVAVKDTFQLLGVRDNNGCFRTGDLQTLTVESGECASPRQMMPVVDNKPVMETKTVLGQNYPNPATGGTIIPYKIGEKAKVNISLYDISGRLVRVIVNSTHEPGMYTTNINTGLLSGGIYYYRMQAGEFVEVKKMVVK